MKQVSRNQSMRAEKKARTAAGLQSLRFATQVDRQRIRVFVRQPFTESGNAEKEIIQGVLDVLGSLDVDVITGLEAQNQDTFRTSFEKNTGMAFTPVNFRSVRLGLLQAADAMVFIRTSLSESGAFEAAYNVYGGSRVPMFFAVWKHAPIKTTLLRDLDEFCTAEYVTFETPEELRHRLVSFIMRAAQESRASLDEEHADRERNSFEASVGRAYQGLPLSRNVIIQQLQRG